MIAKINRINKKAELETDSTVVVVIGILVLILVVGIIVSFFVQGPGSWFKSFLPDFNKTVIVTGVEKIRYDALTDKVQYFNEKNRWVDFNGAVSFDDKGVIASDVKNLMLGLLSYKKELEGKKIELDDNGSYALFHDKFSSSDNFGLIYPANILLTLNQYPPRYKDNLGKDVFQLGEYLVTIDNKFSFIGSVHLGIWESIKNGKLGSDAHGDYRYELKSKDILIKNEVIKQRDEILTKNLAKPFDFTYIDSKTQKPLSVKVCVERNSLRYFNIDLLNPPAGGVCN